MSTDISYYNDFVSSAATLGSTLPTGVTWTAVASTPTTGALNNAPTFASVPIFNTAGQLVASGSAQLWNSPLTNPICFDENGNSTTAGAAWTGSYEGVANYPLGEFPTGSNGFIDAPSYVHIYEWGGWQPSMMPWVTSWNPSFAYLAYETSYPLFALSSPITVPEPSTFALLGVGAIGLIGYAWRRRARLCLSALLVVLLLAISHSSAHAAPAFTVSGNVTPADPSTWNGSTTAYVGKTTTGAVSVTGGTLVSSVAYLGYNNGSAGTVGLDGGATTWTNRAFYVGEAGGGTLNISNGAAAGGPSGSTGVNPWAVVGDDPGSTGAVTVDGAGSTWSQLSDLSIAVSGRATMTVSNGGSVNSGDSWIGRNAGSTGKVTVDGNGSTWTNAPNSYSDASGSLYVGNSGSGTLTISNGGKVSSGGYYGDSVGNNAGSTGSITITGSGSKWTSAENLFIGNQGNGTVTVSNGGTGITGVGGAGLDGGSCIGYQAGSTGLLAVDGAGSTWTSRYRFAVGYNGNGTMLITNGGSVSAGPYIAYNPGSTGVVTVDGAGSTWSPGTLSVGYSGAGTLNIAHGGAVVVAGTTCVANNPGSSGSVNFGPGGGTLTTKTLWTSPAALTGTGTINANGLATDVDLLFDATHSASQTFTLNRSGQNITINLDMSSASNSGDLAVGYAGSGSVTVRDGVTLYCQSGYLGYQPGSSGVASVDGATWQLSNSGGLFVGYGGSGTLAISKGASVNSSYATIGYNSGSRGVVTVDGANSTWNAPYGFNNAFGVGGSNNGSGSLTITNGGSVRNQYAQCTIGVGANSTGAVTVDGAGSTWLTYEALYVGNGTLDIANGGVVTSGPGFLGYVFTGTDSGTVRGAGSKWNMSAALQVGYGSGGSGKLSIAGGGVVAATGLSINSLSLAAIDIGHGSSLTIGGGTGTITNNGTIRVLAGAGVPAGIPYTPITAGFWSGGGVVQAVGGVWNASNHQFTASAVETGTSGSPLAIALSEEQRVLVVDGASGGSVGVSFLAETTPTLVNFTATTMDPATLNSLDGSLAPGQLILSGWNLSVDSGYTPGDPAYLSFGIGPGYCPNSLEVWQYSGSAWSEFAAGDLTYDGNYASFTVTGFEGYALTGIAVPEPSTLALLGVGAITLLGYAWRRRRAKA